MLWVGGFHNVLWAKFPILLRVKSFLGQIRKFQSRTTQSCVDEIITYHVMSYHIISYHIIINQIKCKFVCPTCFLNIRWFHQIKAIAIKSPSKLPVNHHILWVHGTMKPLFFLNIPWNHHVKIPWKSHENHHETTTFPPLFSAFSTYRWQDEESDSGSDGERRRVRRERKAWPGWRGW